MNACKDSNSTRSIENILQGFWAFQIGSVIFTKQNVMDMKILLAEDDLTMSQNIRSELVEIGYDVEVAYDGLMAEKFLKKYSFDCLILDINLPHRNGYEICRFFRTFNDTTPVLFLTAFDELEDKVQGYDSGADDYLTKPFYMKELILRLQSLVKRSRKDAVTDGNEQLVFDDIVIYPKTKTVRKREKELVLTPREYQLLMRLVAAKGELVLKSDLIREIWGNKVDVNTNTIEVYINFLRNKVDKPFDTSYIKTKVGYGYYLSAEK